MLPDRVSNPGPLTYESGALPIALRGPASFSLCKSCCLRLLKVVKSLVCCNHFDFIGVVLLLMNTILPLKPLVYSKNKTQPGQK